MFKNIQTLKEKVIVIIAIILGSFILCACISAGASPLLGGVIGTVDMHMMMADCEKTTATYVKSISRDPNDEEMHAFIYEFCVNEDVYWIETDYEASSEPEKDSKVMVYYNPSDPTEAFIRGMNSTVMTLVVGTLFTLGPVMMIISLLAGIGKLGSKGYILSRVLFVTFMTYFIIVVIYIMSEKIIPNFVFHIIALLNIAIIMLEIFAIMLFIHNVFRRKDKNDNVVE